MALEWTAQISVDEHPISLRESCPALIPVSDSLYVANVFKSKKKKGEKRMKIIEVDQT